MQPRQGDPALLQEPEQATQLAQQEPDLTAAANLKKSASAGSAVFALVARAGGTPGPPSRQTSREFAAEHGMLTPPGSARCRSSP